jgi:hypothetical protein
MRRAREGGDALWVEAHTLFHPRALVLGTRLTVAWRLGRPAPGWRRMRGVDRGCMAWT